MKFVQTLTTLTLLSLPLYIIRCNDLSGCWSPIPLTLLEILILASVVAWIIWRYISIKNGQLTLQSLFKRLQTPFLLPAALFLAFSTVSIFTSPDIISAAGIWKAFFIEPALFYLVVLDLSLEKRSVIWVVVPLLLSGFLVTAGGLIEFFQSHPERVTSFYSSANAVGLYLGPLFLLGLGLFLTLKRNFKFLVLSYLILLTFILILTKSRGTFMALSISSVIFFSYYALPYLPKVLKKLWFMTLAVSIAIYFLASSFLFLNIERYTPEAISHRDLTSNLSRLCLWEGSKKIISEKPFFGVGLNGFRESYKKVATCEKFPQIYPHNIILNFWVEIGIFGLLSFFWMAYWWGRITLSKASNPLVLSLLSVLIYIFIHGSVDVPYFKNDLSAEVWIFLAMASFFSKRS